MFSDEANFVRVKTLLACDLKRLWDYFIYQYAVKCVFYRCLSYSMNIHPLKHHLVFDLKRNKRRRDSEQLASAIKPKPNEFLNLKRITVKDLVRQKYPINLSIFISWYQILLSIIIIYNLNNWIFRSRTVTYSLISVP